jgi:hypothetical protein
MPSESARMSSAAEARFRIQAPNSKPRTITVIALDARSEAVVRQSANGAWSHATFLTASANVVMVATPGGHAEAAPIIGRACRLERVMTTALVVGAASASDEAVSATLAQVRPWSLMVVIANPDDYIDDMLVALRA